MYCHLRPNDAMPLQTENCWVSGHQRPNFDSSIYIRYAAPPYSAGTVIMASVYER